MKCKHSAVQTAIDLLAFFINFFVKKLHIASIPKIKRFNFIAKIFQS